MIRNTQSPAGTRERRTLVISYTAALLLYSVLTSVAAAQAGIASVSALEGRAFAYKKGSPVRTLQINDQIEQSERIVTGQDTTLTLVFTDETELELGESTVLNIDDYRYQPQDSSTVGESRFSTSIVQGVVRAVTGLLAKRNPRSVLFRTSVATIGIRGTHFTAEVQGTSAMVILLAQLDGNAPNAIEVSNQYGKVEIDEPGYGTEIPDANSPPSPPRKMTTTNTMNRILRSSQTTRRVRVPRSPMR